MFTKNVFTQKDPIADLVKPMLEAQAKAKMEELKGNQAVLDKNKNNKLDAQDFKILRGEKKAVKEENVEESSPFDWKKPREPEVKGGAGVKAGRAYGGAAQKSKPEQDDADDKKKVKEDVEQIDELSKSTLGSYVKNAARDVGASRKLAADFKNQADKSRKPAAKAASSRLSDKFYDVAQKRHKGIGKAVERLTKEEVEQVDERTLTKGETSERERIVKGMKKGLAGFKARYGDRAKSVMYATATKAAKKD